MGRATSYPPTRVRGHVNGQGYTQSSYNYLTCPPFKAVQDVFGNFFGRWYLCGLVVVVTEVTGRPFPNDISGK